MIKGAEHVLKSTEWKKKTKKKDCVTRSVPKTKVWGYVCPAYKEQAYIILVLLLTSRADLHICIHVWGLIGF